MIGNIQDMNTKLVFKFKLQNSFMYYDLDMKLKKNFDHSSELIKNGPFGILLPKLLCEKKMF